MRPGKGLSLTGTLPNAQRIVVPKTTGVRWSLARILHDERLTSGYWCATRSRFSMSERA